MNDAALQARQTMRYAFDRLKESVTADDASFFQITGLADVKSAARELEHNLADRQELRNLRRLEPLFEKLEALSKALRETHCGTQFIPWIWKVSHHLEILDRLISAYKKIAQALPALDEEFSSLSDFTESPQILAHIYAIVLDFHHRIYTFLKPPGWASFFGTSWKQFKRRIPKMLDDLATQRQLLARKADIGEILQAKTRRENWQRETDEQDEAEADRQRKTAESWLQASKCDQEDELDELLRRCHEGSCDWIHDNEKIKSWVRHGADHSILWLKGKPGSGKSVLCSRLIQNFQISKETTVLYFLCTEQMPESKQCGSFLRGLVRQIIQKEPGLCAYIHENFILQGHQSSVLQMRRMLPTLLSAFSSIRIVVDGVDECDEKQQKAILDEAMALARCENSMNSCKVLISSQDVITISRKLYMRSCINLSHEHTVIQAAITSFVHSKIRQNPLFQDTESKIGNQAAEIEQKLVNKADGMFLWVILVISEVENAYSFKEMRNAVDGFPQDLDKVLVRIDSLVYALIPLKSYDKIFERRHRKFTQPNEERAFRIFQWLACSQRPLKKFEIQDAVSLHPACAWINDETRLFDSVVELCKPLVENGPNDVVRFVHASVKEYLLKPRSLFTIENAHFTAAFSCLAYLNSALTLIDDRYDEKSRLIDVAKGFHGFCLYASKYWIEHLLAYMKLKKDSQSCNSKEESLLKAADNLAVQLSLIMQPRPTASIRDKLEKLDGRHKLLKAREPIYALVASTLITQWNESIAPKNDRDSDTEDPFLRMRQKYEDITKQLLQTDSLLGLDENNLLAFKKTYGSSVLFCRFSDCPRGLRGFDTVEERDAHQKSHEVDLRCKYSDCAVSRIGVRSAKRLKQHYEEFHPTLDEAEVPASSRSFIEHRVGTDVTLVGSPRAEAQLDYGSEGQEDDDGDTDPLEEVGNISKNDLLALRTTDWNM